MTRAAVVQPSRFEPEKCSRTLLWIVLLLTGTIVQYGNAQAPSMPSGPTQGIGTPMGSGPMGSPTATRGGVNVHIAIQDEDKKPLKRQALIRLTNQTNGRVLFETTRDGQVTFSDLPTGKYLLEVGSSGYLGIHEDIDLPDAAHDLTQTVALSRDPAAVDLTLKDAKQLPSKARKEAEKGVQALVLANFVEAQKHLEAANRQYPSSSSINFLLGYLALQQRDQDRELSYLSMATKLDPSNLQAQSLLGQLYYERGEYERAIESENIVVAASEKSVMARKVLANSYLKLKQYDKARENAQWVVDQGGSEAVSARLILGEALAGLQKYEAAIQMLKAYLDDAPATSVTLQVRKLIAQLQDQVSQGTAGAKANIGIGDPDLAGDAGSYTSNAGMPADIDAQKPSVVAGVACPTNILAITANPSKQLVDSIAQFSAIEHMVHESLSAQGTPRNRETRQYNYVAAITEPTEGTLTVQEFRDSGDLDMPDKITTTGLPVLAIAFHPLFRDDFEMQCEGLGDWNGQSAWLVHFRQYDQKPGRLRSYVVNKNYYPVSLKGRAWIGADNHQIIHLETDLVHSIPEINLITEHTSVSYGPVQFKRSGTDLWLPQTADLYVHFGKRRFHRTESFDHFMLFATDAVDSANKLPSSKHEPSQTSGPQGDALR